MALTVPWICEISPSLQHQRTWFIGKTECTLSSDVICQHLAIESACAARERCVCTTALGLPVLPEVLRRQHCRSTRGAQEDHRRLREVDVGKVRDRAVALRIVVGDRHDVVDAARLLQLRRPSRERLVRDQDRRLGRLDAVPHLLERMTVRKRRHRSAGRPDRQLRDRPIEPRRAEQRDADIVEGRLAHLIQQLLAQRQRPPEQLAVGDAPVQARVCDRRLVRVPDDRLEHWRTRQRKRGHGSSARSGVERDLERGQRDRRRGAASARLVRRGCH